MTLKSYGQAQCATAAALDVVGARWTLLILRDLMAGPARYVDLHRGLPGLASNLLTDRLRGLEEAGLVERMDGPYDVTLYQLTPLGERARPTVEALGYLGLAIGFEQSEEPENLRSWAVGMQAMLGAAPPPSDPIEVGLELGDEYLALSVEGTEVAVSYGAPPAGTAVVNVSYGTVRDVLINGADPQRLRDEATVVSGEDDVIDALAELFGAAGAAIAASVPAR